MGDSKLDLLQGTLDLMVLQTLAAMGSLHGYGIARRIEQVSGNEVLLNQGTIYAALVRLEQRGWIDSAWGVSGNNRKAKFYSITSDGRGRLVEDARYWQRLTGVMDRIFDMDGGGGDRQGMSGPKRFRRRVWAFFAKKALDAELEAELEAICRTRGRTNTLSTALRLRRRGGWRWCGLAECSRRGKNKGRRGDLCRWTFWCRT